MVESQAKEFQQLDLLNGEVLDCARHAKIWLAISEDKRVNDELTGEFFWGYAQDRFARLMVIDGFKIVEKAALLVKSVIKGLTDEWIELLKECKFESILKEFRKILYDKRDWRDKRFCHIEVVDLSRATFRVDEVFEVLSRLKRSLNYLMDFVNNPRWVEEKKWREKSWRFNSSSACPLALYFDNDPAYQDVLQLLSSN